MSDEKQAYKGIFKYTFLFGFVQVVNILTKILLNKVAAIFLGTEGIGTIGIFQSVASMLKTFFGLGISQSAVRDISKANKDGDEEEFSQVITVTHKVIWFTSLAGAIFTVIFSSYLSVWSFGNDSYTSLFILLAIVIFLNILADGQLGILKGMRQLRALAKATVFGSFTGLIAGVPFYYFLGKDGIVPTLLAVAISAIIFSTYYVKKIKYRKIKISAKDTVSKSSNMVKMGIALMYVAFLGFVSEYVIKIYIGNTSSLDIVGIYQVGVTLVTGYFGIVVTAMSTDYYPRISAVYDNNQKLTEEMNRQSEMGLLLIAPLVVFFLLFIEYFITFLYSTDFLLAQDYVLYALFGTIIIICSNSMGMILLAKQNSKVFTVSVTFSRVLGICVFIYTFKLYGIVGLGVSALIMALVHIALMQGIMYKLYSIVFYKKTIILLIYTLFIALLTITVTSIDSMYIRIILSLLLLLISCYISFANISKLLDVSVIDKIKSKFKRVQNEK